MLNYRVYGYDGAGAVESPVPPPATAAKRTGKPLLNKLRKLTAVHTKLFNKKKLKPEQLMPDVVFQRGADKRRAESHWARELCLSLERVGSPQLFNKRKIADPPVPLIFKPVCFVPVSSCTTPAHATLSS